ncbi:MAG: primosomal protein N' [candidate division WOR-3 bacterium]|nr:primosomal protein N' [candidate division WOR-3 bacterium]
MARDALRMTPAAAGLKREASGVERYCNVAIPHTRLHELTYEFEPERFLELAPGACVQVRLRGKKAKGLVLEVLARSPVPKTLPVEKLVEPRLVSEELLRLLRWVGAYYFGRMGAVLGMALPRGICGHGLRRGARGGERALSGRRPVVVSDLHLSSFIFPPSFSVNVHTGSGSQEDVVAGFVGAGLERGTVIVLMPESETGVWAGTLRARLGIEPVLYHGDRKASERKSVWREVRSSERMLVLGVRSAVFAPVPDLAGVVVIDEHDKVFKEERHPRFNARDVAIARARLADCPVLLCDPTPSAETWLNLRNGQYQMVQSPAAKSQGESPKSEVEGTKSEVQSPAAKSQGESPKSEEESPESQVESAKSRGESTKSNLSISPFHFVISGSPPDTLVVDMRKHRGEVLAPVLVNELKEARAAGESSVLYINRRGLSRYVACRDCGSPLLCTDCGVSLVLYSGGNLCCRYCGKTSTAPETCPACGSPDFRLKAPGIEMAAREVSRLLPDANVLTVLTESVHRSSPEPGSVVVGTRALFGVHWPERVRVVAALSVDDDLCLPDFRARERTFQVLSELSRRAAAHGATLVLQTRRPDDPAVQAATAGDVARFLDQELKLREELEFPPYRRLVLIELSAASESKAARHGEMLCRKLGRVQGVEAMGPVPVRGRTNTVQVLVKVARNLRLDRLVTLKQLESDGVRARVDVDPLETV